MAAVSLRAYAKHRGVTLKAVQKAIQSGRIHTTADGKIDAGQADSEWERNTGPKVRRTTASPPPSAPQIEPPRADAAAGTLDYAKARAIIAHYEARLAKIDYEERIKKLINADEMRVPAYRCRSTSGSAILSIRFPRNLLSPCSCLSMLQFSVRIHQKP